MEVYKHLWSLETISYFVSGDNYGMKAKFQLEVSEYKVIMVFPSKLIYCRTPWG